MHLKKYRASPIRRQNPLWQRAGVYFMQMS
jgi:hypothetical protein